MKSFLAECRRRRVFRLAGLYVVGCWVALQVADLAFESWGISPVAIRYVWIAAIIGFPVALFFGWRFDIVGGRILRTDDGVTRADLSLQTADYLILTAVVVVLFAAIYGIGSELGNSIERADRGTATEPADPRSIAVLPFTVDSAGESDIAFLADGIQDELLTRLSLVGALKVTSRTSVERYRDTTIGVPTIGRELGVAKVLEGRIQRSGDQIRVNVQLVDAQQDDHVWAQVFDRQFTASNVFSIQTEIVESIASQLEATITPRETRQLTATPTEIMPAYTEYLKGKGLAESESVESLTEAASHFRKAIEYDPGFALAYVGLADAYLTLSANFKAGMEATESTALAEPLLMRALDLEPDLGEAYASLGLVRQLQNNVTAAEEAYRTAMELRPNYSRVFRLLAKLKLGQGLEQESHGLLLKALAIDPYSVPVNFDLARYDDVNGDFERALERYRRIIELEPDHAFSYVYIAAIHYLVYGRADESLVWYQKAVEHDALSPSLASAQAIAYLEIGDPDAARIFVDRAIKMSPRTFWPLWTSLLLNHYVGDDEAARRDAHILLEVYPRNWGAHKYLRNADIAQGRFEVAALRYARAFPELTEYEEPLVIPSNLAAALDLAQVLQHLDQPERASDLLQGALTATETLPRLGTDGFWIADVQAYALQGHSDKALAALREAIDQGWRVLAWFYLDHDPNLESIRGHAEFQRQRARITADMAAQAKRAEQLRASGDLKL
jgi:TolB-like protein/Tfp pilus assembly protein PilF